MTEVLVPLSEVAVVLGKKPVEVETEALRAGLDIVADRRGRPSLRAADAQSLAETARIVEHAARWRLHMEADRAWVEARHRAAVEAASAFARRRVGQANGVTWAAARAVGSDAAAQYERTVPRPTWDGRPTEVLHHVSEEEAAR